MPFFRLSILWRCELRQQEHNGSQKSLSAVVEESILTVLGSVAVRVDDGLGKDLGIFFCARTGGKVLRMLACNIHVVIHQCQEIKTV